MQAHDSIYTTRVSAEINRQLCEYRMTLVQLQDDSFFGANAKVRDGQLPIVKEHIVTLERLLKSLEA